MGHAVIGVDRSGWPVLLSDPPVAIVKPAVSAAQAERRDLVRELAREFEDLSVQDLTERIEPVKASLGIRTASDIAQLQMEVRAQVLDDLVDVLDQRHRGRLRARRTVRLQAPKGYTKKVTNGLSAIESGDISSRLRARGWSDDDVRRTLPHQSHLGPLT
jgi:hypothetical protein